MYYVIVDGWSHVKTYDTLQGARVAWKRKYIKSYPNSVIMDSDEFKIHKSKEPTHLVRHLLTGEMVEEKVSTPYYLSVSSEAYWST